jgi:hypothetical protein
MPLYAVTICGVPARILPNVLSSFASDILTGTQSKVLALGCMTMG